MGGCRRLPYCSADEVELPTESARACESMQAPWRLPRSVPSDQANTHQCLDLPRTLSCTKPPLKGGQGGVAHLFDWVLEAAGLLAINSLTSVIPRRITIIFPTPGLSGSVWASLGPKVCVNGQNRAQIVQAEGPGSLGLGSVGLLWRDWRTTSQNMSSKNAIWA